jgi:hypothetical protein
MFLPYYGKGGQIEFYDISENYQFEDRTISPERNG